MRLIALLIVLTASALSQDYVTLPMVVQRELGGRRAVAVDTLFTQLGYDITGIATIGANDSTQLSITGVAEGDHVTVTYYGGNAVEIRPASSAIWQTGVLTVFGEATWRVAYLIRRKPW